MHKCQKNYANKQIVFMKTHNSWLPGSALRMNFWVCSIIIKQTTLQTHKTCTHKVFCSQRISTALRFVSISYNPWTSTQMTAETKNIKFIISYLQLNKIQNKIWQTSQKSCTVQYQDCPRTVHCKNNTNHVSFFSIFIVTRLQQIYNLEIIVRLTNE